MPTTGDRIRGFREDLGWTLEELAKKTQLSKGFLSDVETNKRNASTENALKIANAMGASLDYLLRGETARPAQRREPVQIPSTLSIAAEQLELSYADTLTLLETHRSVIARRSNDSIKPPTVEDWKRLYTLIKELE
ncbi:MAG TPA: helix-turn-helix domain-containing protein [Pyrinomonadaceae bacterium]|nr:helix-turn-helix domain-containing protein [Pyrinomonadaceae bacterium]